MGMSKVILRVQNLILVTIIPAILLVVIVMASVLYSDLYNTILNGFDKKLFALGSSVASFIDGEEHLEINNMEQFRGVVYRDGSLYANTFAGVHLLKIDLETGEIERSPNEIGYEGIGGLTYVSKVDKIYGVTFEAKELIEIDPITGIGRLIGVLDHDVYGIAYDSSADKMFGNTYDELVVIDYNKAISISVFTLEGDLDIQGLTFHQGRLMAVETESGVLYEINLKTASSKKINKITHVSGESILFGVFDLTSAGDGGLFVVTTVSTFKITKEGVAKKVWISNPDWSLRNNLYAKYVLPMIRLKDRENATFLYTAILKNQAKQIYYNIDSTQSSIHSFIGYSDPDPANEQIRDVWFKGDHFLSEVVFWEEWGFLKSSYVPIKSKLGEITGYAGADVNIDVINEKTKEMLIFIVLAGLLAIFVAILISLTMTKTLTQPIEAIKRAALKIASGSFGLHIQKSNVTEISDLADSFNALSYSLDNKISSISEEISKKDNAYIHRELIGQLVSGEPSNLMSKWAKDGVEIGLAHKLINNSNMLFFWKVSNKNLSEIEKVNISASIRLFIDMETRSNTMEDLIKQMNFYFEKFLDYLGAVNFNKRKLYFYSTSTSLASSDYLALLDSKTGEVEKIIAPLNIKESGFEKVKNSHFLLFGNDKVLDRLKKIKKEQLKNHSLTITLETIDRFLGINVEAGLASAS